jgi:ribokinase
MILVFGSINLDTFYPLARLPVPGQTVIGPYARIEPGGKGANQAVAAARDGARVALAGAVGQDRIAEAALAGLVGAGVDISRVAYVPDMQTGKAAICVDPRGQNQIAVAAGANLAARADQVADADLGPDTTLLLQMETSPAENASLIRRGRARGARIILNLAPSGWIAQDALHALDWLVVNLDEAGWLGEHVGTAANAASLRAALGCGVVRTRGVQGFETAGEGGLLRSEAVKVDAVDTTGAGDCFLGVFAAALDRGEALPVALRRANVAAALSCTRPGGQGSMPIAGEIDAAWPGSPEPTDREAEMQE